MLVGNHNETSAFSAFSVVKYLYLHFSIGAIPR
jgi:hypothetical protein